jgi:uncharacterized protein (TIGR03437 family)
MTRFLPFLLIPACFGANLAYSTYLRDGFTPFAIASDAQGNVYLAGSAITDPATSQTGAAVAKLDPSATHYVYLTYFDSASPDTVNAIAVDSAGNAYIAGSTTNANFPVTAGTQLGTPPAGNGVDERSFVAKLSPNGAVLFAALVGGSVSSKALGIALSPAGQLLVSGTSDSDGFPSTPGAYSVPSTHNHWYLMELDASASKMIFSSTGIGGSSIVVDASGSIYLAGSSVASDYPVTPGAYQTHFFNGHYCYGFCQIGFFGELQHVTKVDAAASKLIYSTGINDTGGLAGRTLNTGLAVDAAGNAYVTGTLFEAVYPFTVPALGNANGFLTKLDPTGSSLGFSIPVGGAGVQLDSSGAVYAGGVASNYDGRGYSGPPPGLVLPAVFSSLPKACWPNDWPNTNVAVSGAYIVKVDAAGGVVLDGQWIDGSEPGATAITLAGGKVWLTGVTPVADVPFTPGALAPANLVREALLGVYLAAADFSPAAPSAAPVIGCVMDQGNMQHVSVVAGNQLLTLFGTGLGPAAGVAAGDRATSLAGVTVTFDGTPARLLYVSSSQINLAVPRLPLPGQDVTVMQVSVNGATVSRQLPVVAVNLNLFANLASTATCTGAPPVVTPEVQALVTNADGSLNSCVNPAKSGSTVSFYMHGARGFTGVQAMVGNCSADLAQATLASEFVFKVDLPLPLCFDNLPTASSFPVTFSYYSGVPVGPVEVPFPGNFAPGPSVQASIPVAVWVTQ